MEKDLIIKQLTEKVSQLEEVVNEYEAQTRIDRVSIFTWCGEEIESDNTKPVRIPKNLSEVIKAIDKGCSDINKKKFSFSQSNITGIGRQVKEIIDNRDGDSRERIIARIVESIEWKINMITQDIAMKKYWSKQFFTRTRTNNLSKNLYHYEEYLKKYPMYKMNLSNKNSSSKPSSESGFDGTYDYGIDLDW